MRDKAVRDAREEQQELEALHRLDEECVHQQRAGNYLKAFDCMERALVLRRHFFGIESEEVIQACRALAEMCNLLAMSFLQQDNYAVTIDLLKKAEVLTQRHHPAERATTMNNLACYYRRLGKLHSAMASLKRALELEKRLENVRNAADTQLNMCAVLSQLGKHQEALEHAQEALITLQEGFIHTKHTTDTTTDNGVDPSSSRLDRISVMCIAYHNIGVEQEFLKDCAESVASYKKGIGLAEQYLGVDHSITITIRNSYLAAKRTLATKTRVKPRSANRNEKSPTKAGTRLLSSPRSDSLRMPSPLAKDHHNRSMIPTPRSIIAEALSRAPMSALPPLEVHSSPSTSKKKKSFVSSEVKSTAPPLSPTDPFFSPRFRFDSGATEPKVRKLTSITNPQTVTTPNVEAQAPPSSNGTRDKRTCSLRKSSSIPGTSGRSTQPSIDDGTDDSISIGTHAAQNAMTGATSEALDSPAQHHESNVANPMSALSAQEMELTVPPLRVNKSITGFVLEYVDGAISTVLSHVVGTIAAQGYDPHSRGADGSPADERTFMTPVIQETFGYQVPEAVDRADSIGLGDNASTLHEAEEYHDLPESYDAPIAELAAGTFLTIDELTAASGESSQQFTEGDASESNAKVSQETAGENVDKSTVNGGSLDSSSESAGTPVLNDLTATKFASLEPTSGVESSRIRMNEETSERNSEVAANAVESGDATTIIIREPDAPTSVEVEATDNVIVSDNDMQYNQDSEDTAPVESMLEDHTHASTLGSPDGDPTILTGDVDEQDIAAQVDQHISNVDEDFTVAMVENETQKHYLEAENYETGDYNLNFFSDENPTAEAEDQDNTNYHVYQETNNENYIPPEFANSDEYPILNSEQQSYEYGAVSFGGDTEQDWSSAEQGDHEAVGNTADYMYSDSYQDSSIPSHEEQFSYDGNDMVSEYASEYPQQEGEGCDLPSNIVPNDGTIDVDTNVQELTPSE